VRCVIVKQNKYNEYYNKDAGKMPQQHTGVLPYVLIYGIHYLQVVQTKPTPKGAKQGSKRIAG
jgi:hypothetical protein